MENSIQNMPADVWVLSVKQKKPYLTFNAFLVLPWENKQDQKSMENTFKGMEPLPVTGISTIWVKVIIRVKEGAIEVLLVKCKWLAVRV